MLLTAIGLGVGAAALAASSAGVARSARAEAVRQAPEATPVHAVVGLPDWRVTPDGDPIDFGGGPLEVPREEIPEAERREIEAAVAETLARLAAEGRYSAQSATAVTFDWPLRPSYRLADYGYHGVSGFMDHDPAINALRDYTCGTRTYDLTSGYNHRGTDFYTTPYPWLKMDNFEVEIVAAAPGTLAFKRDGQYDRQCSMNGDLSNAVVVAHGDGTVAWYLHMKKGSVTTKPVGSAIAAGEYLGVVGSSGSSTGPHLHFEVRNAADQSLDPFHGACNPAASMWASQPPYYDSSINRLQTGLTRPVWPSCPNPETPNVEDSFAQTDTIYFITFYRDQLAGQQSTYRVYRPDGSVYTSWTHASTVSHYASSWWYWSFKLGTAPPAGTWRFAVDYEGQTYQTHFNVGAPAHITVTLPNGGEVWSPGAFRAVAWADNLGGDVRIDLYRDGAYVTTIDRATPSDGVRFWSIPGDLPVGDGYTVRVTNVANQALWDESDAPFTLTDVPTADFYATPVSGTLPLDVAFTDASSGVVDAWLWAFGDGITGTVQHPTHTYTLPGVYTVTLAVGGPAGSDVLTRTGYITATYPPLVAALSAYPILGTPPLTVTFKDLSSGPPIDLWAWEFGDGMTSTLRHPAHVYSQTGVYTVTLAVGAGAEMDTLVRRDLIHVVERVWGVYLPLVLR